MRTGRQSGIAAVCAAACAVALSGVPASRAEPPARLALAMYAPSVPFADSSSRAAYIRGLAHAIEARTGIPTTADSFADYSDLVDSKPDLAILDAPCVVVRGGGALATASIGGSVDQAWGLYAREAGSLAALAGKRLAYLRTGCRDSDFLDNAMLASEVESAEFFGKLVGKNNLLGVIATVRDYRDADAVFAPGARAGGLTEVLAAGRVANPGLVAMRSGLDAALLGEIKRALLATGKEGGVIDGWREPTGYAELAARMAVHRKPLLFAIPERLRLGIPLDSLLPREAAAPALRKLPLRPKLWLPAPVAPVPAAP
jgi:hypothetical protein